ncbi:MAG: DNA primase [Bacteroidales bacterium]|nr:DNA primase [Bacteroidales bacterium]
MIDHNTIERILDAADIVEVVNDFVNLKKRGVNYLGLCPFHNEKTPSFTVSPAKGIFKCFGCGKGGNPVNFIMEHENLSYPEALRYLAKKYNIDIVEKELTEKELEQNNERESLLVVSAFATHFFIDCLFNSEEGKAIGLSYFKERGFRDDILKKFELGYSPDKRDAFTKKALQEGHKLDFLVKTGLTIQKDDFTFDRFAGRIIFPIHSLSGKVIAFGGRTLRTDKNTAKYLNSPESEIYHKSKIVYGILQAKKMVMQEDKCYLVEGYTDVLSLHQSGIENVVASSGTALTVEQIRLIKRFTPNITIIYDGDEAGIKASLRGIDLVLEEGLNLKVVLLPDGEDPDSFSKKHSATELLDFINSNEKDFISFKTKLLIQDAKNDPVKRAGLITDIVKSIAVIPNTILRAEYIKECSSLLNVNERILYSEINKIRRQKAEQKYRHEEYSPRFTEKTHSYTEPVQERNEGELFEKELVRLMLAYGNRSIKNEEDDELPSCVYIINELNSDDLKLKHPLYSQIFEEIQYQLSQKKEIQERYFLSHPEKSISQFAVDVLSPKYKESKLWKRTGNFVETEEDKYQQVIKEAILAFKNFRVQKLLEELQESLVATQEIQNEEETERLYQQFVALSQLKINLAKNLGQRTVLK